MIMRWMLHKPSPSRRDFAARAVAVWQALGAGSLAFLLFVALAKAWVDVFGTQHDVVIGIGFGVLLGKLPWLAVGGISTSVVPITLGLMVRKGRITAASTAFETDPQKSSKLPDSVLASKKAIEDGLMTDMDAAAYPQPPWLVHCTQVLDFYESLAAGIRRGELDEAQLFASMRVRFCETVEELAPVIRACRERQKQLPPFGGVVALYEAWRHPEMASFVALPKVSRPVPP